MRPGVVTERRDPALEIKKSYVLDTPSGSDTNNAEDSSAILMEHFRFLKASSTLPMGQGSESQTRSEIYREM